MKSESYNIPKGYSGYTDYSTYIFCGNTVDEKCFITQTTTMDVTDSIAIGPSVPSSR